MRLTIIPAGADSSARTIVTLVRDEIKLEDQAAKAKLIELPKARAATCGWASLICRPFTPASIPSNTRDKAEPQSTTADVAKLLDKLKQENVDGVILDLRAQRRRLAGGSHQADRAVYQGRPGGAGQGLRRHRPGG